MKSKNLDSFPDRQLLAELRVLNNATTGNEASYTLTAAMTSGLNSALDAFESALDAYDAAQAAETSALNAKYLQRKEIISAARAQMKLIRATPGIKDSHITAAGLDVYDTIKTASSAPTTAPVAWVDYGKLKHTIYFRDSAAPDSEAKPKGMQGAEIWSFIGAAPPASDSDYEFVALDTNSPYTVVYSSEDGAKKVFYQLRWLSKNGEAGEWSETIEATING